jgi:hypothetical protein
MPKSGQGADSVYLLYWHKSTNTDAEAGICRSRVKAQTQFTCFTGTRVQILTQKLAGQTRIMDLVALGHEIAQESPDESEVRERERECARADESRCVCVRERGRARALTKARCVCV